MTPSTINHTTAFANKPLNHSFHTSVKMASNKLNSDTISDITAREKMITGQDDPVKGGPTAQAQKHAKETVNPDAVSDITQGERKITGAEGPIQGGPAAVAQSMATQVRHSHYPKLPSTY